MRYSPSIGCGYPEDIEYQELPTDLITVSDADWATAMNRAAGDTFAFDEHGVLSVTARPPMSGAELKSMNASVRNSLLMTAALAVAPLQDAVDLAEATDAEVARLALWKQHRVAVNRVDLTQAAPVWPNPPAA